MTLGTLRRFLAVAKYEILWNLRKKKLLGMLIIALIASLLQLVLPPVLRIVNNEPIQADPNYLIPNALGGYGNAPLSISGAGFILLFLFAVVIFMDTISAEFETGTIVPLLTKPVSRDLVFAAKYLGAFLMLLATYGLLYLILLAGALVIYGPQNNLHLYPALMAGTLMGTLVFASVVLAMGSLKKSSILAAIGSFGILIGIFITGGILEAFGGQAWLLTYAPGSGRGGAVEGSGPFTDFQSATFLNTGTAAVGATLTYYLLHPSATLVYFRQFVFPFEEVGKELLADILLRQLEIGSFYILSLTLVSWLLFRRAQITEA